MKDINEVLRRKEIELKQLQREVEALRLAVPLLADESEAAYAGRPSAAPSYIPPVRTAPPVPAAAGDAVFNAPWDAAAKKFP